MLRGGCRIYLTGISIATCYPAPLRLRLERKPRDKEDAPASLRREGISKQRLPDQSCSIS